MFKFPALISIPDNIIIGPESSQNRNHAMTERNMRIEDLNYETNETNTSYNIYDTHPDHAHTVDDRLPRWDESDPKLYGAIKTLISEKEKVEKDTLNIKKNDKLLPRDKLRMLKSARNLSCTINTLLERSKDRLSEYYDSQLRDKSVSPGRMSSFNGFKSVRSKAESLNTRQFNLSKFISQLIIFLKVTRHNIRLRSQSDTIQIEAMKEESQD